MSVVDGTWRRVEDVLMFVSGALARLDARRKPGKRAKSGARKGRKS